MREKQAHALALQRAQEQMNAETRRADAALEQSRLSEANIRKDYAAMREIERERAKTEKEKAIAEEREKAAKRDREDKARQVGA